MNALVNASTNPTMSSREIAVLADKRHDHVMADIRTMLESLNIQPTEFSGDYKDPKGRTYPCFNLPKRETLILVSGYNIAMRAKIIDRWQELEAKQAPREPNRIELAQWVIEAETKLAQANEQLAIAAPKAAAHDRIADAAGLFGVREAAKILGIKQNQLVSFLLDRKWAYRDERKTLQGYADKLNAGYIEHIFSPPVMTSEGEKVFNTMRLTAKGVSRISEILAKGVAA